MRGYIAKLLAKFKKKETGFTLVELLVVVGIIVGLAAAVVPRLSQFSGKGEEGSQDSEIQNLQSAVDAMMADYGISNITDVNGNAANSLATDTSTNNFSAATGLLDLETPGPGGSPYLREFTTKFYYCWDANGSILSQDTAAVTDCTDAGDGAK